MQPTDTEGGSGGGAVISGSAIDVIGTARGAEMVGVYSVAAAAGATASGPPEICGGPGTPGLRNLSNST